MFTGMFFTSSWSNTFTMNDQIQFSEVKLLTKIFVADLCDITLFDPHNKVVGNNSYGKSLDRKAPSVFFNFDHLSTDKLLLNLSDYDYIFDFTKCFKKPGYKNIKLDFITNTDGTIRWLYSPGKTSQVLCFYNASNWRSKIIENVLKKSEQLGLGSWVKSGSISIFYKENLRIDEVLENRGLDNFSVFTGTPGQNRTALMACMNNSEVKFFSKLPLNSTSEFHVEQEAKAAYKLSQYNLKLIETPLVDSSSENGFYTFSNVKKKNSVREKEFTPVHANALNEIFYSTFKTTYLLKSSFWKGLSANLQELSLTRAIHSTSKLVRLLELLKKTMNVHEEETVSTCLTHSDFTPWNMFVNREKLEVYDWEMMQDNAPALFDLFHFHFQRGILIEQKSIHRIIEDIHKALKLDSIDSVIKVHNIDVERHLKLYLLQTISFNLLLFRKQKELSLQHEWLINAWEEILLKYVNVSEVENQRTKFIKVLNRELGNYPHAFLKFNANSLEKLDYSSDLDIAIKKEDINKISSFSKAHILVNKSKVISKSFMTTIELFFKDGSFLSIDLINQLKRKNIEMMDIRPLLASASYNENDVIVPEVRFDIEYCLLFYTLNNSSIPLKYATHFNMAPVRYKNSAVKYINEKYGLDFITFEELFVSKKGLKDKLLNSLKTFPSYSPLLNAKNGINYLKDTLTSVFKASGFVITFTGVDGVGKSTVINLVKDQIEHTFRKEVVLKRHRPGILPILSAIKHGKVKAEDIASKTIPRKGKNKNVLSSILRFTYYYTDYLLGQVYVHFKYTLRGKIVLYDRYYFDFINDSKRSNIHLNKNVVKWLYSFIFKPRLNIFLYADPQVVYKRKQELDPFTIEELTMGYKDLFTEMGQKHKGKYTALENKELDKTIASILKEFTSII